jgi:hypothetical protein
MDSKESLLRELKLLPDFLIEEVQDFVIFLKNKWLEEKAEAMLNSETSLSKDWLKSEEDQAWAHL